MLGDYKLVIITNLETLPYFKRLKIDGVFQDLLSIAKMKCLLSDAFFEFGEVDSIPVVVKKAWHNDNHYILMLEDAFIGFRQASGRSININKDTYLEIH